MQQQDMTVDRTLPFPGKGISREQRLANMAWARRQIAEIEMGGGGTFRLPSGEYDTTLTFSEQ